MGIYGPLDFADGVEIAITQTLSSSLNSYIDIVWAQRATYDAAQTSANFPVPAKVYPQKLYAGYREELLDPPFVMVYSTNGRIGGHAEPNWQEETHEGIIEILFTSDVDRVLDEYSKRYLRAVQLCIRNNPGLDGSVPGLLMCSLTEYQRGSAQGPGGGLVSVAQWKYSATVESTN